MLANKQREVRLALATCLALAAFTSYGQESTPESQIVEIQEAPPAVESKATEESKVVVADAIADKGSLGKPQKLATEANDSQTDETEFLRVTSENDELKSLDTAVVRYSAPGGLGVTVDLIGAVHIGEASYYEELNELFNEYDVLLYELVAPEGTVIPRGGKKSEGFNPVAMLQDGAKKMLGLESQLNLVDYTKEHFVRADMSPTQIAEKMAERGDTAFTLALDTFADIMRQQNLASRNSDEGKALFAMQQELGLADMLGNPLKMKRMMALQFASTGSLDQAMGKSLNQLLIVDRNGEALKGLQKQIAAGKKKIGIFYGAAHLADFETHLVEDFGLEKSSHKWLSAWDLTTAKKPKLSEPMGMLLNLLEALD